MQICPDCGTEVPDDELYCVACGQRLGPDAEADSFIGHTVGGSFLIERLLGEGAMGRVYKARQLSLNKTVALKILHRHLAGEKNMARRFHREARAASRLNHRNSLHIIDFGDADAETFYIAMEYIEGKDLLDLLDDSPLALERIVELMVQVCDALEEAHAAGIVHRDLKPENIMVVQRRDEREEVKVCDFGIAKIREPKEGDSVAPITVAGIVCGTPEYMSPEQGRGEDLDGRSDLYSAGVILYQLSTGELPFSADTALGVVTRHLTEEPLPPTRVAPDSRAAVALENVILRAMAKKPEDRYQTAAALKADLLRVGRGETISAFIPVAGPGVAVVPPRRPRWPVALAAGAVAAVGAGLVVWLVVPHLGASGATSAAIVVPVPPPTDPPPSGDAAGADPGADAEPAAEADGGAAATPMDDDGGAAPALVAAPPGGTPRRGHDQHARSPRGPGQDRPPPRAEKAPEQPPPAEESPYDLGMRAFRAGDVNAAIRQFERSRAESPGSARVHRMLGKCYYRVGQIDQGRAAYRRYLELRPDASDRAYIEAIIGG